MDPSIILDHAVTYVPTADVEDNPYRQAFQIQRYRFTSGTIGSLSQQDGGNIHWHKANRKCFWYQCRDHALQRKHSPGCAEPGTAQWTRLYCPAVRWHSVEFPRDLGDRSANCYVDNIDNVTEIQSHH